MFIISKGKLVASDATENLINLMSKNQEINLVLKSDEIGARGMLEKIVNVDKVTFEKSEEEKTVKAKVIAIYVRKYLSLQVQCICQSLRCILL